MPYEKSNLIAAKWGKNTHFIRKRHILTIGEEICFKKPGSKQLCPWIHPHRWRMSLSLELVIWVWPWLHWAKYADCEIALDACFCSTVLHPHMLLIYREPNKIYLLETANERTIAVPAVYSRLANIFPPNRLHCQSKCRSSVWTWHNAK